MHAKHSAKLVLFVNSYVFGSLIFLRFSSAFSSPIPTWQPRASRVLHNKTQHDTFTTWSWVWFPSLGENPTVSPNRMDLSLTERHETLIWSSMIFITGFLQSRKDHGKFSILLLCNRASAIYYIYCKQATQRESVFGCLRTAEHRHWSLPYPNNGGSFFLRSDRNPFQCLHSLEGLGRHLQVVVPLGLREAVEVQQAGVELLVVVSELKGVSN